MNFTQEGAGGNFEQFNILYKTGVKANFYENRGLVESLDKSFLKSRAKYLIFHQSGVKAGFFTRLIEKPAFTPAWWNSQLLHQTGVKFSSVLSIPFC